MRGEHYDTHSLVAGGLGGWSPGFGSGGPHGVVVTAACGPSSLATRTYHTRSALPWNTLLSGLVWIIQIVSPRGGAT